MNWQIVVAIVSIVGVVSQFGIAAFVYGKLTQSNIDTKEDVKELKAGQKEHGETLVEHGEAIAGLQSRPRYVNGSSH